jgi:hypothetical protein
MFFSCVAGIQIASGTYQLTHDSGVPCCGSEVQWRVSIHIADVKELAFSAVL